MEDAKALAKALRLLAAQEFSVATANAVNRVAGAAHSQSMANLRSMFILRNKFTMGSMVFFKATPKSDADSINAITGTKSPYLDEQEIGGDAMNRQNDKSKSVPTLDARGGDYKRTVGSRYFRKKMGTVGHRKAGQRVKPAGARFFWLNGGGLKAARLLLRDSKGLHSVYQATHGPIKLKPTGWHAKATAKFGRPEIMAAAFNREIEKGLVRIGAR